MKQILFLLLAGFNFIHCAAQGTIRIEIVSKPGLHTTDTLYIAGSFNNWQPSLAAYRFSKNEKGIDYLELKDVPQGFYEYKITRGSWSKTESTSGGQSISNRSIRFSRDTVLQLTIEGWMDDFPGRPPVSTKSKQVFIADTAFYMPQLQRHRRIWIYLPEDYFTSKKHFPVLYMQDGQNLFDALTAPYGEWGADEMMDTIKSSQQCIIVGIDHGDRYRLTEYNPFDSRFGKGEGNKYVEFIVTTLKPFIDSVYRTKPGRESTMIAGSSMGGLISFYAALKFPEVFGGAGVFSPSFWIAPMMADELKKQNSSAKPAFYFVCGDQESNTMVTEMKAIYDVAKQSGYKNLFFKSVPGGRHNERFWQQEFYECYQWLRRQIR
ncbi:alpha/beta hydrolase-fold protein [Lacibacter sp. MH-610]|uniref:alpha/beta hydrolase n=1 Tax=Lacibacter sp. MH-610 TaxID=3020883 RepID=UPI00389259BA